MKVISRIQTVSLVKFKKPSRRSVLLSQAEARKIHFMRRFRERVGYALSDKTYKELLAIFCVQGKFLYKNQEVGSVWTVNYNGLSLKVVWDVYTSALITVLP